MNDLSRHPWDDVVIIQVHLKNGATAKRAVTMAEYEQAWDRGAYVHRVIAEAVEEARQFKLPPCTI